MAGHMMRTTFIAAVLVAPVGLLAQKVIPPSAATKSGNKPARYPFTAAPDSYFTFMHIIEGSFVAKKNASITSLAYRRSTANSNAYIGRTIPWLNVIAGHARRLPLTMFRQQVGLNSTGLTTVMSGKYVLPAQKKVTGLAPFNIVFPFKSPFVYTRATGGLFFQLAAYNAVGVSNPFYDLDGHVDKFTGGSSTSGVKGQTSRNENYQFDVVDKYQLTPGGRLHVRAHSFSRTLTGFLGFGVSNKTYMGAPLPLDLKIIGAPGNALQHSWDAMVPFPIRPIPVFTLYQGEYWVTLPNTPTLYGLQAYAQFFVVDPTKNALGLVFSNLLTMNIQKAPPVSQSIMTINNSAYYYMVDRETMGGPVMRLGGTFN
jgi:hypothetical protein